MLMPKQCMVKLNSLTYSPWNPVNRIKKERLAPLVRSLDDIGQVQPIIITADNQIIEGHRRVAAAKLLDWKAIRAEVISEEMASEMKRVYASVNYTLAKHSGNDILGVWLSDADAVRPGQAKRLANIEASIGRQLLHRMYRAGLSSAVFTIAKRICDECDAPDKVADIIEWLMRFKCAGQVRKIMEGGHDPHVILKAARSDKPIKFKVAVA